MADINARYRALNCNTENMVTVSIAPDKTLVISIYENGLILLNFFNTPLKDNIYSATEIIIERETDPAVVLLILEINKEKVVRNITITNPMKISFKIKLPIGIYCTCLLYTSPSPRD